jgi:hypothetical protein
VKPIRDDNGRYAGSIGEGKSRVPTAAPTVTRSVQETSEGPEVTMAQLHAQHIRQLAVQTDTELAERYRDLFRAEQYRNIAVDRLHYLLHHDRRPYRQGGGWVQSDSEALEKARTAIDDPEDPNAVIARSLREPISEYDQRNAEVAEAKTRIMELDAVYRQHRWNRAFLVPGGHVHSSQSCVSCNKGGKDTEFVWLPQYSGASEEQIVEDAGERACTMDCCYPSAPTNVLQRPTRIYSDDERRQLAEAEERRAQREASRAARAAKAPTATGEPLVLTVGTRDWQGAPRPVVEELKTERTAVTFAVDIVAAQQSGERYLAPYNVEQGRYEELVDAIVDALAEKRNVSRDEVRTEIDTKAEAKVRKWRRR